MLNVKINSLLGNHPNNYESKDFNKIHKNNTFFFCTIQEACYLQTMQFGITSYYDLSITDYMAFLKNDLLNYQNSYFKLVCELNENDINMFCRSNKGNKEWSGQIIKDNLDLNFIKDNLQQDILLFLAPPKKIVQEWRVWVINETVSQISPYNNPFSIKENNFKIIQKDKVHDFVCKINDNYTPDINFVIDICQFENELKVVEYNCLSTSGFYNANIDKIIKDVKNYYE